MSKLLWQPTEERIKGTNMYRFMNEVNEKHGKDFKEYRRLLGFGLGFSWY